MISASTVARLSIVATLALCGAARADDGAFQETFGDWTVELTHTEEGSAICRLSSDVEGMVGEAGLIVAADGTVFLSFRDDRVHLQDGWVGRSMRVEFADGPRYTLTIARLLRSGGTGRPANTLLARLGPADRAFLHSFYAGRSLSLLLPDGSVHDALLAGAGDAAEALSACTQRVTRHTGQSRP